MNPLEKLVEFYCVKAYCGYAGRIILHFNKDKELLKTESEDVDWIFETISSAWRLSKNEKLLTGSYEDYEHNDNEFKNLLGKKLLSIEYLTNTDIKLKFENDFHFITFNHGNTHETLEVYTLKDYSKETHLILQYTGEWRECQEDEGFTNEEKIRNKHSEKCCSRWENIVPPKSVDNNCRNCAYFLSNSGEFYFWDFGLCSNEKSDFDGRVVAVKSSCEYFDSELNTEENAST